MEDKAFDNEEMYQKRIQVQEIENTSISDGECDEGLKLRRKHKHRRSKAALLQIENEKLKEELRKRFDLKWVREIERKCEMNDNIICDKCIKITQENAELNKKLEWMGELQQEYKEMEQYVKAMEMLRNGKLDILVRNSELIDIFKKQIKQYKSDEKEYSEKIDELILQCDDLTQQK
eukprot:427940_1